MKTRSRHTRKAIVGEKFNDDDEDILFSTSHEENNNEMILSDDDDFISEDSSTMNNNIIHIGKPTQFFEIPLVRFGQQLYIPLVYAKRFLNISTRTIYAMYGRFETLTSLTERVCLNGNEMKTLAELSKREGLDRSLHIKSNRNGISLFQIEKFVNKVVEQLHKGQPSQESDDDETLYSSEKPLSIPEDYSISSHAHLHDFILNLDNNTIETNNVTENAKDVEEDESVGEIQSEESNESYSTTTTSLDDDGDDGDTSHNISKATQSMVTLEEYDHKIIDTCPLHYDGVKNFQKLLVHLTKERSNCNVLVPLDY
ncbi:hypothetical protein C9374_005871 [Naegleria lovaniensis]|uniref:Uncharacterized protein n=1 Tax=Naegleria lovaniensis TaxID=51637 RepID=A0AA88GJE6_NAELO|nr:uncharacterized protein C9374_005871 [Naegleria lovaniensis]KAG2382079.1 hypothetical protein C9374_005871 [Naegleria lovaniensis]